MVPIPEPFNITLKGTASVSAGPVYSSSKTGFAEVVAVQTDNTAKAGAIAGVLKIGSRTAATLTFTSDTRVDITPSTTKANIRGTSSEVLTIEYTSDGTGALTNDEYDTKDLGTTIGRQCFLTAIKGNATTGTSGPSQAGGGVRRVDGGTKWQLYVEPASAELQVKAVCVNTTSVVGSAE